MRNIAREEIPRIFPVNSAKKFPINPHGVRARKGASTLSTPPNGGETHHAPR
jgi:hypothetical protein